MTKDWQALTKITGGEKITIEKVRFVESEIVVEGRFELPPLAKLRMEDQIFAAAFLRCHGSIKQMEQMFGVSYPTIKSRLNRIGEELDFVKIENIQDQSNVLSQLERGEIDVTEALSKLEKGE